MNVPVPVEHVQGHQNGVQPVAWVPAPLDLRRNHFQHVPGGALHVERLANVLVATVRGVHRIVGGIGAHQQQADLIVRYRENLYEMLWLFNMKC